MPWNLEIDNIFAIKSNAVIKICLQDVPAKGKLDFTHNSRIQHTGRRVTPSGRDDTLPTYPPQVGPQQMP